MSSQYYADTGYGIKNIILKPEESIPFEKIKELISRLKNNKLRAKYEELKYEEFFDTTDMEYENSQPIWELLLDIIYEEKNIELEFVSDDDYNELGKCLIFRDISPWNQVKTVKNRQEATDIFTEYIPLITKKQFTPEYICAIQYG